MSEQSQPSG